MGVNSEKLVKQTIKLICKTHSLEYDEVKTMTKKYIKMAKNYDQQLLGMMEELLDLGNCSSEDELVDFDIEVLKIYCRIKEIESSGSDKSIRRRVWDHIEEEMEDIEESDESGDDSGEDFVESDESDGSDHEVPEPEPVIEKVHRTKKSKSKVVEVDVNGVD